MVNVGTSGLITARLEEGRASCQVNGRKREKTGIRRGRYSVFITWPFACVGVSCVSSVSPSLALPALRVQGCSIYSVLSDEGSEEK